MLPTFVIGLREGLEASLIVGIIAAFLLSQGRREALRQVWVGVAAAVALCLAIGIGLQVLSAELPQKQKEGLETVVGLFAVAMVTYMIVWMRRHSREMKSHLEGAAAGALESGSARALVVMAFLAVLREGFETAVFLLAMTLERREAQQRSFAMSDPLTGLLNRRAFADFAARTNRRRAGIRSTMALLVLDLDHFKSVNDRFGHATGDEALKLFARTASACMRADDAIGRLGGEEFAAVVPGGEVVASGIAERIRAAFEAAGVIVDGHQLNATVSIGAAWTSRNVALDKVLAAADAALYRAKESGRNRMVLADMPIGEAAPDGETDAATADRPHAAGLTIGRLIGGLGHLVREARRLAGAPAGLGLAAVELRPAEISKQPSSQP